MCIIINWINRAISNKIYKITAHLFLRFEKYWHDSHAFSIFLLCYVMLTWNDSLQVAYESARLSDFSSVAKNIFFYQSYWTCILVVYTFLYNLIYRTASCYLTNLQWPKKTPWMICSFELWNFKLFFIIDFRKSRTDKLNRP